MSELFEIVYEDAGLLVINKPAGLVCHPTKGDAMSSLISRVRLHLGSNGRPHLVNRLDRETSGLVVVAKTEPAVRLLRKVWENRRVEKEYLAIVHGRVREERGTIAVALGRDLDSHVAIKDRVCDGGTPARTDFEVLRRFARAEGEFTVLRVTPHTGRKHQIRIHLAHAGYPIVGDKLYGGDEDLYMALVGDRLTEEQRGRLILPYQALHASSVRFAWEGKPVEFQCEPEKWFAEFAASRG
jgi:23S rRNA pseudouridine1911/1915/1917 synthase